MRLDDADRAHEAAAMRASGRRVKEIAIHFDVTCAAIYRWTNLVALLDRVAALEMALRVIAELPMPAQDNMVAANMRKIAREALTA